MRRRLVASITHALIGALSCACVAEQPMTPPEFMQRAEREMRERQAATKAACTFPPASDAAKVVLFEAYGTEALSTVTIGSQSVATESGRIIVEPGEEPLYIVVASYRPVIWQFSGAIARIERLVMAGESTGPNQSVRGETPLVGATGVPAERIVFLGQPECMTYHAGPNFIRSEAATEAVRSQTGQSPVVVAPNEQIGSVTLPSGQITMTQVPGSPRRPRRLSDGSLETIPRVDALQRRMLRFHPGAWIGVDDPSAVVASKPVERYEVLPQEAGLIQLEQDGALERNEQGEFLVWKKIKFPADLHGSQLVRFRIQKDVPMPAGDPGHSCVIMEETGMALHNAAICAGPFGRDK